MIEESKKGTLHEKYLRAEMLPTIFCNGCGHGAALDYTEIGE